MTDLGLLKIVKEDVYFSRYSILYLEEDISKIEFARDWDDLIKRLEQKCSNYHIEQFLFKGPESEVKEIKEILGIPLELTKL